LLCWFLWVLSCWSRPQPRLHDYTTINRQSTLQFSQVAELCPSIADVLMVSLTPLSQLVWIEVGPVDCYLSLWAFYTDKVVLGLQRLAHFVALKDLSHSRKHGVLLLSIAYSKHGFLPLSFSCKVKRVTNVVCAFVD
jgi:hypothetical protein